MVSRVRVIDSHTGGEPTRLVIEGLPELQGANLAEKAADFGSRFDDYRTGLLLEPRGSDVWVGALLLPPSREGVTAGVIFFNNVGVLGMCGHGTIGLVVSLAYLERLAPGEHVLETPVGDVMARLNSDGSVTVQNVMSYRSAKAVEVEVPGYGMTVGDVAYGGNWFFLVSKPAVPVEFGNVESLTRYATAIKSALIQAGITGDKGAEIDHIELFAKTDGSRSDSKSFVLCPGNAYDRSPCGTGTSAKVACLAADEVLAPGRIWRQESIVGSVFLAEYSKADRGVLPRITGDAHVTAESTLVFQASDPFRAGIA